MSASDAKENVIVVGGGGAGGGIARALSKDLNPAKYNLILVTERPFQLHLPSVMRTVVTAEGKLEEQTLIPFDKLFINNNGTIEQGSVVSVESRENGGTVVLQSGKRIDFRVLVVAPGWYVPRYARVDDVIIYIFSIWEGPIRFPSGKPESLEWINDWRNKFAAAKSAVLVGGGAVGIGAYQSRKQKYS